MREKVSNLLLICLFLYVNTCLQPRPHGAFTFTPPLRVMFLLDVPSSPTRDSGAGCDFTLCPFIPAASNRPFVRLSWFG